MKYPHTLIVKEIPVPAKMTQVTISTDYGTHVSNDEFYADPEEFLAFWKPLVDYYERLKNDRS